MKPRKRKKVITFYIELDDIDDLQFEKLEYLQWNNENNLHEWVEVFQKLDFTDTVSYKYVMVF